MCQEFGGLIRCVLGELLRWRSACTAWRSGEQALAGIFGKIKGVVRTGDDAARTADSMDKVRFGWGVQFERVLGVVLDGSEIEPVNPEQNGRFGVALLGHFQESRD